MEITSNLHAHTVRCNHASGTEREYIENALKEGLTRYGFADHAPYPFPEGFHSGFRMRVDQQKDYVDTLTTLGEEYRGRIEIPIGYEAEYYPAFFGDFLRLVTSRHVDYLILGQHFLENEITGKYSGRTTESEEDLKQYVDQVCEALETEVFTYVAHPDLMNYVGDERVFAREYGRLIRRAKALGVPLEINLLGIRGHRAYPHERFFELCGEIGAEVVVGSDAHEAEVAVDRPSWEIAEGMAKRFGLKVNRYPELRPVRLK